MFRRPRIAVFVLALCLLVACIGTDQQTEKLANEFFGGDGFSELKYFRNS